MRARFGRIVITLTLPYPLSVPGIYRITDAHTGRFYIGSSVNIAKRWRQHQQRMERGTHPNPMLQAIWNRDPARLSIIVVRSVGPDRTELLQAEQAELDLARAGLCRECLNVLRVAGSHLGARRSEATRSAMAAAQRGRKASDEAKARMRAAKVGIKHSEAVRRAQSERQRGKKLCKPRRNGPATWARFLTDEQVRALRQRRAEGVSWRLLGLEFGLNQSAAKRCALGISYREVL